MHACPSSARSDTDNSKYCRAKVWKIKKKKRQIASVCMRSLHCIILLFWDNFFRRQ